MKKTVLRGILLSLLLALAAAGFLLFRAQSRLEGLQAQADSLLEQKNYGAAMTAYGQLLQRTPLSFFGGDRPFVIRGAAGVLSCGSALLDTPEGAALLAAEGTVSDLLSLATNPAVPAGFSAELTALSDRARGQLLEAEEQARRAAEAQAAAEAEAQRRQALLEEALQARSEGRLEEALALLQDSGLQPELIPEIETEMETARDRALAAEARTALEGLRLSDALSLAEQVKDPDARTALRQELENSWRQMAEQMHNIYRNKLWAGAWYTLALGEAPLLTGDRRYEGLASQLAGADAVIGGAFGWMKLSGGRVDLVGDTLGATDAAQAIMDARDGALGWNHGLILHGDGTVTHLGNDTYGRAGAAEWTGITQVAAGGFHSLGLTKDGTVVAAGLDLDGQCQVGEWTGVVALAAGLRHSVALTADGRVLACGDDSCGQCDVADWENVVDVRCGANFTLGLTAEGKLLATGDNGCGQCDVADWENVIAFDGGLWHTAALLQDGRVVTAGAGSHDQRALQGTALFGTGSDQPSAPGYASGDASGQAQAETEFVYTGDQIDGPWLYFNGDGAVIVSFDEDTGRLKATRADLICTWGHPPVGILAGGGDTPKDRTRATRLAWQNRAVFALTGDYYTMHRNAKGILIRRGKLLRDKAKTLGCAFFPDGSFRLVNPAETDGEQLLSQGIRDAWVFGPVLIAGGELQNFSRHSLARNGEITMRTVLATFCPYHHLAAAYGFTSLKQVAEDLMACHVEEAYNLDGGRSSMMVFMGEIVNKTAFTKEGWRGLRDMVGFLTSDLVPES